MQHLVREFDASMDESYDTSDYKIGDFTVSKNESDMFDVYHNAEIFLENLSLLSAALAVTTLLTKNDFDTAKQVLFLEQKYAKHYSNMLFFANSGRRDLYENEKIDAEWCLRKIQTYILLPN